MAAPEHHAEFHVGGRCQALSVSPDQDHVAVGGRDVFKIIRIHNHQFALHKNVRSRNSNLNFATNDIKWHPVQRRFLATGATNGVVVVWDLEKDGKQRQRHTLTEHTRSVNRVAWHPEESMCLLTGSQDGTVKEWDLREDSKASVHTYRDRVATRVRDLHVSPFYSHYFAVGYENGDVKVWDRRTRKVSSTFRTHQNLVLSVHWHPQRPDTLASGHMRSPYGGVVQVWNLNQSTPTHVIQTIAAVARVQWRPDHADHIASSSSLMDVKIRVWDIQRPHIPFLVWGVHKDVATGIQWVDGGNSLLSCSFDERLVEHYVNSARYPYDHIRTVSCSWSPHGQLATVMDPLKRAKTTFRADHWSEATQASGSSVSSNLYTHLGRGGMQVSTPGPASSSSSSSSSSNQHFPAVMGPSALPTERGLVRVSTRIPDAAVSSTHAASPATLHNKLTKEEELVFLARHYKFRGASVAELCQHNAEQAAAAGRPLLARSWAVLRYMFRDDTELKHAETGTAAQLTSATEFDATSVQPSDTGGVPYAPLSTHESPRASEHAPEPDSVNTLALLSDHVRSKSASNVASSAQQPQESPQNTESADSPSSTVSSPRFVQLLTPSVVHPPAASQSDQEDSMGSEDEEIIDDSDEEDDMDGDRDGFLFDTMDDEEVLSAGSGGSVIGDLTPSESDEEDHSLGQSPAGKSVTASPQSTVVDVVGITSNRSSGFSREMRLRGARLVQIAENLGDDANSVGASPNASHEPQPSPDRVPPSSLPLPKLTPNGREVVLAGGSAGTSPSRSRTERKRQAQVDAMMTGLNVPQVDIDPPVVHSRDFRQSVVSELLDYSVNKGDVQSCVAFTMVLRDHVTLSRRRMVQWFHAYIDRLKQLELYTEAAEVVKYSNLDVIGNIALKSTTVHLSCPSCNRPSQHPGLLCNSCSRPMARCSVCRAVVNGLFVWCQGCGHGGHLSHMQQWFASSATCPAGCMHKCVDHLVSPKQ